MQQCSELKKKKFLIFFDGQACIAYVTSTRMSYVGCMQRSTHSMSSNSNFLFSCINSLHTFCVHLVTTIRLGFGKHTDFDVCVCVAHARQCLCKTIYRKITRDFWA